MSTTTTFTPYLAKHKDDALPIPEAPPVTIATLPFWHHKKILKAGNI